MGTHPIFESDFECLTEPMSEVVDLEIEGVKVRLPRNSEALNPSTRWHFDSKEFTQRIIKGHKLSYHLFGELDEAVSRLSDRIFLEDCGGDKLVENFEMDEMDELLRHFDECEDERVQDEEETIFKPARFELMEKLVHSDAVTHVVDLEQRMKNERRIVIKNREISLQKMAERHSKELKSFANADMAKIESRHFDDRKRIEEHFHEEVKTLEAKQRAEFLFNAERLLSESARGVLKDRQSPLDDEWVEIPPADDPIQQETFTVNLGNQLKVTQNLRLVRCNLYDEIRIRKVGSRPQRLESLFALFSGRPCGIVLPCTTEEPVYTNVDFEDVRKACLDTTDFVFPSFDEQFIAAQKIVHDLKEHRVVVTRHSNLSAAAHCIFHLFVGKLHAEKTIESRHPTLLALRTVIRECAQAELSSLQIPLLLTNTMQETMTAPWCLRRAELVMKCIKGFLIEFPLSNCTVHFTVPLGIDSMVFKRIRDLIPDNFRLTVALNI